LTKAALLTAFALALAWVFPGQALAHAVLQHTAPHQNASVTSAPSSVRFDFNEPVEVSFGALRVYDTRGERVDEGGVTYPGGDQESVAVGLRGGLGRGVYTATYRVVSADGHPVSGGFAFGVGEAVTAERGTPEVADLLARSGAGPAVEGTYGVVRGLHYAALLLIVGAIVFRLLAWPRGGAPGWPGRLLGGAAAVGLLSAIAGIALQGMLAAGVSLDHAFDSQVLRGSVETRVGGAWLLRSAAWLVVFAALVLFPRGRSRELAGVAVPVAVIVGSLPYAGHADTQSPQEVLVPADIVHVLAAGAWLGGLVLLLVAFWPRRAGAVAGGAAEATARFSRLALPAIVALVAAGAVQAWFHLGSVGAFFDTTYGWALVAKIALLGVVVVLAYGNRRRVARLGDGGSPRVAAALRRSMRSEVALAVLVLGATATLVRAAPPATIASGPVIRELDLGPMRIQMDIEPATVGPNDYHLYLFERRSGAQVDRVKELTIRLVQSDRGIGPITLRIPRKGPAHYELRNSALGVAGTWEARVTARVSKFDEYSARTTFKVRPAG
jgi:copper transport protein